MAYVTRCSICSNSASLKRNSRLLLLLFSCPVFWDLVNCTMPGLPVLHYFPEFAQTHAHWVGDAIQPSYLCCPFSFCLQSFLEAGSFPMSQLLASGCQSIGASDSASVLPMSIQNGFPLGFTGLITLLYKGLSRVFSSTTVWKHRFFGAQPSLWSTSHIHTWLLEKPQLWQYGPLLTKWCVLFLFLICCLGLS